MPDRILTDSEARSFLDTIDTVEDPQLRQRMGNALSRYRDWRKSFDKSQRIQRRRRLEDFYVGGLDQVSSNLSNFQDPNGVERTSERDRFNALLELSSNPQEDTARFVNQAFISETSGVAPERVIKAYDVYRSEMAKKLKITGPVSDQTLFTAIKEQVQLGRKRQDWAEALAEEAFQAGVRGSEGHIWKDYLPVMEQMKGMDGYDPAREDDYAKIFKQGFEQGKEFLKGNRDSFEKVFDYLGTVQGLAGFESDLSEEDVFNLLDESTPEDLKRFAQYAATRGDEIGLEKGFLKQSVEALWRGVRRTARQHKRRFDRASLIDIINAVEKGNAHSHIPSPLRVRPGASGDKLEDLAVISLQNWPKATSEQKGRAKETAEKWLTRMDRARQLVQIAEGAIDPIRADNVVTEKVWYPFLENIPFTAQAAIPFAGAPMVYSSVYDMRYEEIRERNPALSRGEIAGSAALSAAIETPVEWISARLLMGKAPSFSRLFKPVSGAGTSEFAKRAVAAFAIQAGEQYTQERIQDATPLLIQMATEALNKDIPETDWSKEWAAYADTELDTFLAILPLALIGGSVATVRDFDYAKKLLSAKNVLKAAGISEEWADKIVAEKNLEKQEALFMQAYDERDLSQVEDIIREGEEALKAEREAFESMQGNPNMPTIEPVGDKFNVYNADGEAVARDVSFEQAQEVARDIVGFQSEQDRKTLEDAMDYVREIQESGSSITFEDREFTVAEVKSENPPADIERFVQASAGVVDDTARVLGQNVETTAEEIFSDVTKIFRGATPATVIEERAHSYFKRQLQSGAITWDDVIRWKDATDPNSERTNDEADLHEWLADQSVAYVTGQIDSETARRWIPESVLAFFERLKEYAGAVVKRAAELMALQEQGKLDKGFEKHLARSVGLDEAYRGEKHQKAEQARAEQEALLDVDRGPEKELKKAVKELGGIPTTDPVLQGELDTLRDSFGKRWSSVARKKAKSLDELRGDLVDLGFDFQTPSDLIDALDRAAKGEEVFPTTFSVERESWDEVQKGDDFNKIKKLIPKDDATNPDITFSVDPNTKELLDDVEKATVAKRKVAKRVQTGLHKGGPFPGEVVGGLKNTMYERLGDQQATDIALAYLEDPVQAQGIADTGFAQDGSRVKPKVQVAVTWGLSQAYKKVGNNDASSAMLDRLSEIMTEFGQGVQAGHLYSPLFAHGQELADAAFARHYVKRQMKKAADSIIDGNDFRGTQQVFEDVLGEEVRNRRKKGGKKRNKKELSEAVEQGLKERNLDTWQKAKKAVNELLDKMDEGEISPASVTQILHKTWKLPRWNKEIEKRVDEWSEKIAALPEYSSFRDEDTIRFLGWLHDQMEGIDAADLAWSIWYANVLSGYKTTLRNVGDSSANAALSILLQGLSWNPVKAAKRGVAVMGGLKVAIQEAFEEAKRSLKTGHSPFAGDKFRPGDSKNLGAASALNRLDNIQNPLARAVAKFITVDGRVRYVSNFLTAQDAFIGLTAKELRARMIAADKATSEAEMEALLALSSDVNTDIESRVAKEWEAAKDVVQVSEKTFKAIRVRELRKAQRDGEIEARSADFATRVTYNYEPEGILGTLTELLGGALHSLDAPFPKALQKSDNAAYTAALWALRVGANAPRLVMPFVRIIANLTNVGVDYSGFGLLKGAIPKTITKKGLAKKELTDKTVEQRQLEAKRGAIGLLMIGGLLVRLFPEEDDEKFIKIHGRGPQKFSDRQAARGAGWIPWSIQVGDRYFNYQNVPVAGLLAWIGQVHDDARYRREKLTDKSTLERAAYGFLALGKANLDRSALIGMADLLEIIGRDEMAIQRGVERWMGRTFSPSTAIPFGNFWKQLDETLDDTRPDRGTLGATLMAQTPVLRRLNKPALDILGDEMENRPFDWITSTKQAEARLFLAMAKHRATPSDGYAWKNKMEPEQYYAFQKARGAFVKEQLTKRIAAFEKASQEDAQDWMRKVSRESVKHAKKVVGYAED